MLQRETHLSMKYSPAWTIALVSLDYVVSILLKPLLACFLLVNFLSASAAAALAAVAAVGWLAYVQFDGAEYGVGRPDKHFSQTHWVFARLREYLHLTFHRSAEVQRKLFSIKETGQGIFAFFPHGVNSDFRVLMDGPMYDEFADVYKQAPGRTLAASILFKLPGIRYLCLATSCVDAGRPTAKRCLRKGLSLLLCPGGQDEQIETIYGRERIFLKRRSGFIRLAIEHGVPVVPCYCFGSSDL